MTSIRRKKKNWYICSCFLCYTLGHIFIFVLYIHRDSFLPACAPKNPDHDFFDRQDEWKYQNGITGQWYHWRTMHKKEDNDTIWQTKWLNTGPISSLGVIVYLATRGDIGSLEISFKQLSYLLSKKPRPVVIFHEGDLGDDDIQQHLAEKLGPYTPLGFERIQFFNSSNGPWSLRHRIRSKYVDMCRFFTLMLPHHPLLTLFTYYWRLDAHSYIFNSKPIQDPFDLMKEQKIQFGFIMVNEDGEKYVHYLWSIFLKFLKENCLKLSHASYQTQTTLLGQYSYAIIFTNFAIANVSLFRDHKLMQIWLQKVDRYGGIYRHRWGDAPIHTLALTQLIPREQIVRFRYFGYMHRREYVCAYGIDRNACKEQVKPFLTNSSMKYRHYNDGCWPSTENPLCYYYREIKL